MGDEVGDDRHVGTCEQLCGVRAVAAKHLLEEWQRGGVRLGDSRCGEACCLVP